MFTFASILLSHIKKLYKTVLISYDAESKSAIPTNSPDDPCEHSVTLPVEAKHKPAEPHFHPDASSLTGSLDLVVRVI